MGVEWELDFVGAEVAVVGQRLVEDVHAFR